MGRRKTFRSELRACAVEQHGYVTSSDVSRLGIPAEVMAVLVDRGELVAISPELFRLDGAPHSRWHSLAEAVLRVGEDAVLSHDSVLALHELADHDPERVRVSTPHPVRDRLPRHIEVLQRRIGTEDITTYRGIPSTTISRALLDCRPLLAAELLMTAAEEAVDRGLLLRRERHAVLEAIEMGT